MKCCSHNKGWLWLVVAIPICALMFGFFMKSVRQREDLTVRLNVFGKTYEIQKGKRSSPATMASPQVEHMAEAVRGHAQTLEQRVEGLAQQIEQRAEAAAQHVEHVAEALAKAAEDRVSRSARSQSKARRLAVSTEEPPAPPEPIQDLPEPTEPSAHEAEISQEIASSNPLATSEGPSPLETKPFLPEDRPDWVGQPLVVEGKTHYVSVSGDPADSFEKSLASIDEQILREAQNYFDSRATRGAPSAASISALDANWLRANCLVAGRQYDALLETPSGTYHTAWVQLKIEEKHRRTVEGWAYDRLRTERIAQLGGGLGICTILIGLGHLALGIGARRKAPSP
jgi:hypothetical protein